MNNPDFMQGMIKQQLGGVVPQVGAARRRREPVAGAPPTAADLHPPARPAFNCPALLLPSACPQIAMGAFVNYFFSGFILGRVPFALSPKFRLMLQRGIDLPSLDVTYFTSLSYYILLLFGMRGVFMLAFQGEAVDDSQMMRQMQVRLRLRRRSCGWEEGPRTGRARAPGGGRDLTPPVLVCRWRLPTRWGLMPRKSLRRRGRRSSW